LVDDWFFAATIYDGKVVYAVAIGIGDAIELEAAGWGVANFYGVVDDAGKGVFAAGECAV